MAVAQRQSKQGYEHECSCHVSNYKAPWLRLPFRNAKLRQELSSRKGRGGARS
jgi:hypothetical protein